MLDVFESTIAPWCSRHVEDGRPTPQPGHGGPVHWGCMDDFGAMMRVPLDEPLQEHRGGPAKAFEALGVTPQSVSLSPKGLGDDAGCGARRRRGVIRVSQKRTPG